ncbi:MAG: exosome complex RNA-binding protein Rrp4 [Candidatus Bathyarchaeia archaeon]
MTLFIEKRSIVVPGEVLAEGKYLPGANTYAKNGKIYASKLGLFDFNQDKITVVPFKGVYIPNVNDQVIGKIIDVGLSGWLVDIESPYKALLPISEVQNKKSKIKTELTKILDLGDLILAKVIAFDRTRDPLLSIKEEGLGRIVSGRIVEIPPTKIPRLIGKKGSMINMLKKETECEIYVGQNGVVLISGKNVLNENLAVEAINRIAVEAHTQGLTDRIKELIKKRREQYGFSKTS